MKNKYFVVEMKPQGICVAKVTRPEALNALNSEVLLEMKESLTRIAEDPAVRVLVLTGDGEKSFIAGADIAEMQGKSPSEGVRFAQIGHEVTKLLELMPKPVIAAVNGFALGGGTEMAIACDFILASDKALFGQPEVTLGIMPGFGATARLSKFVGLPRAKELIYSGRKFKAAEALAMGLVNHVFPAAEFMDRVMDVARSISTQSFAAVSHSKKLLNSSVETPGLTGKLDAEAQAFGRIFGTPDQREGMTAFIEKRKPTFQGLT